MALSITVNGGGTFSASMEEGPVSFTASLGAVPGPKGDTGATGPAGVVAATAPIVYTSGTQTVSMDTAYFVRSPAVAGTDTQILSWDGGTSRPLWIDNQTRALFMLGTNKTGTTIAKGKAVYVSGATGNHPEITLAQANAELSSASTIGITAEEIADNGTGKVIVSGRLENVNTNGFTAGDTLYLSPSSAGGFTTTFPTQPNHGVLLGYVTRANTNTGVIEVVVKNYQELAEQSDVLLTSKTNNDLLAYESSSGLWKNKSFSTLGLALSSDLSAYLLSSTAASTYAPLASPTFTGTPTAPTAATTTNTTQIATTAFVQQEVPSASTTAAGKIEIATDAEAVAGTDTARAVTPSNLRAYRDRTNTQTYLANAWAATTSGTGAGTSQAGGNKSVSAPTSAVGSASLYGGWVLAAANGGSSNAGIGWSNRVEFVARCNRQTGTDSNSVFGIYVGKPSTSPYVGALTARGIGVTCATGSALVLSVHNGTSVTNVTSSFTPTTNNTFDIRILSDGTGNVTLFVDGSQVATTSSGPSLSSVSTGNTLQIEAENTNTLTGTRVTLQLSNFQVTVG